MRSFRPSRSTRKIFSIFFVLSILFSQFAIFFASKTYAATSPWTQTDWSGGSGQTNWSDPTKYDSSSNIVTNVPGQLTLSINNSNWYDSSWQYRRKITFDNSDQAENLSNFPVLVKLNSSRINYSN